MSNSGRYNVRDPSPIGTLVQGENHVPCCLLCSHVDVRQALETGSINPLTPFASQILLQGSAGVLTIPIYPRSSKLNHKSLAQSRACDGVAACFRRQCGAEAPRRRQAGSSESGATSLKRFHCRFWGSAPVIWTQFCTIQRAALVHWMRPHTVASAMVVNATLMTNAKRAKGVAVGTVLATE